VYLAAKLRRRNFEQTSFVYSRLSPLFALPFGGEDKMQSAVLQDWTTVRFKNASGDQIIFRQSPIRWLDLSSFEDVTLVLDVKEVSGTVKLTYQTGPSTSDDGFVSIAPSITLAAQSTITRVGFNSCARPVARYLRWILTQTGLATWDATFRILVCCSGPRGLTPSHGGRS
jgi:hypothetical protein